MGIRFYCGLSNEKKWNHHPVAPGAYACVSPVYGMKKRLENRLYVPEGTKVIQDSGAFSDNWTCRLTFEQALQRQIDHAAKFNYAHMITHRASYDLLIDEVWDGEGNRQKRRWTVERAWDAVEETVAAAAYLNENRHGMNLILSAQGVDAAQYFECVKRIVPLIRPDDMLGLGGWCIIGKMPKVFISVFRETILQVIPYAAKHGVQHVHIWGVIHPDSLGWLLWLCNQHGLTVSTDSSGASVKPCFGDWGYGEWRDNTYERVAPELRGLERARHVELTRQWLENFEATPNYREPREYVVKRTKTRKGERVKKTYELPEAV